MISYDIMLKDGFYEELINKYIKNEIQNKIYTNKHTKSLQDNDTSKILKEYVGGMLMETLEIMRDEHYPISSRLELVNNLIKQMNEIKNVQSNFDIVEEPLEILLSLFTKIPKNVFGQRPVTSIAYSSLFTNSIGDPKLYSELKNEIATSDSVDMLISFIKWSGLRLIFNDLKELTDSGKNLRIITTTYMGVTDIKAIDELSKLQNTEIKISYDTKSTRLHAKTYIFKRDTEYSTAYIGSSNLSSAAISGGLEWNIKIAKNDMPDIFKKINATFDTYWNSPGFTLFNTNQRKELLDAIDAEKNHATGNTNYIFDIHPYDYQEEILEKLEADRILRGNYKNLVVSATGTGKTVISAFDYARFKKHNKNKSVKLLFIAHREEILKQSLACFRSVLKDYNFGDLFAGGNTSYSMEHIFMSIQTFQSRRPDLVLPEDYFDFIIIDEFHHAAAKSYQNLLSYFKPKIMLGLTATPERMDGKDILKYFNNNITAEIRLPEAIDKGLLSPFQYFGITDSVDLDQITWKRGTYDESELERLYINSNGAKQRAQLIVDALIKYSTDIKEVKALGFCVSIEHSQFMAKYFNDTGINAISLSSNSTRDERNSAQKKLEDGNINIIFSVDIYNEGVDIPDVNTVLFLRPTESLTVFLQQLGRGLRLSEGKDCLTVLDFIGRSNIKYNFAEKFISLMKNRSINVKTQIENHFTELPADCYIELEKKAQEYILENIKKSFQSKSGMVERISDFVNNSGLPLTLENFLEYYHMSPESIYALNNFSRLLVIAGKLPDFSEKGEEKLTKAFKKICQIDSIEWIKYIDELMRNDYIPQWEDLDIGKRRMISMFYFTVWDSPQEIYNNPLEAILELKMYHVMFNELLTLLDYLISKISVVVSQFNPDMNIPLNVHSNYTRNQILAAFDINNPATVREGVKYIPDKNVDILFVTINKSEKNYSSTTMYKDYAISQNLFHWQTQSTVSATSPTALRYFSASNSDHKVLLFAREYRENNLGTAPYKFLGVVNHESHYGNNPVSIIWKLNTEIPGNYMAQLNKMLPA